MRTDQSVSPVAVVICAVVVSGALALAPGPTPGSEDLRYGPRGLDVLAGPGQRSALDTWRAPSAAASAPDVADVADGPDAAAATGAPTDTGGDQDCATTACVIEAPHTDAVAVGDPGPEASGVRTSGEEAVPDGSGPGPAGVVTDTDVTAVPPAGDPSGDPSGDPAAPEPSDTAGPAQGDTVAPAGDDPAASDAGEVSDQDTCSGGHPSTARGRASWAEAACADAACRSRSCRGARPPGRA